MTDQQRNEATGTTTTVEFRGQTYGLDLLRMTWETLEADQRSDFTTVVRDMLGPEQFEAFKAANPQPLVIEAGDLVNIASAMRAAILGAVGNLSASSSS